jgi:hypothetical protein
MTGKHRDYQGIEFVVNEKLSKVSSEFSFKLFVIEKRFRESTNKVNTISVYYIMDNFTYQAPTIKKVIDTRLTTMGLHLQSALTHLLESASSKVYGGGQA